MNVLIVGYGSIAQKHVNALRSLKIKPKIWALRSDNLAKDIYGVNSIYKYEDIPKNCILHFYHYNFYILSCMIINYKNP